MSLLSVGMCLPVFGAAAEDAVLGRSTSDAGSEGVGMSIVGDSEKVSAVIPENQDRFKQGYNLLTAYVAEFKQLRQRRDSTLTAEQREGLKADALDWQARSLNAVNDLIENLGAFPPLFQSLLNLRILDIELAIGEFTFAGSVEAKQSYREILERQFNLILEIIERDFKTSSMKRLFGEIIQGRFEVKMNNVGRLIGAPDLSQEEFDGLSLKLQNSINRIGAILNRSNPSEDEQYDLKLIGRICENF